MSEIRAVSRSTGLPPKPRETPKRDGDEQPRPRRVLKQQTTEADTQKAGSHTLNVSA